MLLTPVLQLTFSSLGNGGFLIFEGEAIVAFFKLLFVLLAFLYLVFAFVVTRQIKVMRATLITSFSPLVKLLGYLHLAAALVVFIFFIFFL